MSIRKLQLLFHPITITALVILLINDFYWKYKYHNIITGKLSDIAGLILLTIFLSSFFYSRRIYISLIVGLVFIWWKSPLSQVFIACVDYFFSIRLYRTIDYSDYLALPIVSIVYVIKPGQYTITFVNKLAMFGICIACMFGFCATSYYRKYYISPDFGQRLTYRNSYNTTLEKIRY